jgi:hypothetical protein
MVWLPPGPDCRSGRSDSTPFSAEVSSPSFIEATNSRPLRNTDARTPVISHPPAVIPDAVPSLDSTTHEPIGSAVAASGRSQVDRAPSVDLPRGNPAGDALASLSASEAGSDGTAAPSPAVLPRANGGEPIPPDLARAMSWAAVEEARLSGQLELAPNPDTEPTEVVALPWTAPDPAEVARRLSAEGSAEHWRRDAVGAALASGWRPDREQAERMGSSRAVRTQRWPWEER